MLLGLTNARCQVCRWTGTREDLLGVVSEGLTLEERIAKLTQDLLQMFNATIGGSLTFFLARWGVIDASDKDQSRQVTARIVGRMASGVLQYCMGEKDDIVPPEVMDQDEFCERVGVGISDYIMRVITSSDDETFVVQDLIDSVTQQITACVNARFTEIRNESGGEEDEPEGSGGSDP